jgi:hypothetical protein
MDGPRETIDATQHPARHVFSPTRNRPGGIRSVSERDALRPCGKDRERRTSVILLCEIRNVQGVTLKEKLCASDEQRTLLGEESWKTEEFYYLCAL